MNDLERDLHELFDERARTIDPRMLAPTPVLRRGRRRQVRSAVGGALASVLAIAIAVAAIGNVHERANQPAVPPLGERTTSIGGVPVTAPDGWTLVDDWPLSNVLPTTSESCSFSGTGTPVEQNASTEAQSQVASTTGSNGSCTRTESTYPAGVPVLQLANFEIPLGETVCGLGDTQEPTDLPDDGVAVYVARFPGGISAGTVLDACPGSENIAGGEALVTFIDKAGGAYAGLVVAGRSADQSDVAYAQTYLRSLGDLRVNPTTPSASGPGYVVAAGSSGGTNWRLEAAITSLDQGAYLPSVGAVLVVTSPTGERSRTVDLPKDGPTVDDAVEIGPGAVVQFGTAASDVSSIDIVGTSTTTSAEMLAWPNGVRDMAGATGDLRGWLWFAAVPEIGDVRVPTADEPTGTGSPAASTAPEPRTLQTTVNGDGLYTVFGNDFGHDWSFTQEHTGKLMLSLDGASPEEGYSLAPSGGTHIDIPGGTLLLELRPQDLRSMWVTSDVAGSDIVAVGGLAPPADYAAARSNIWVVALPGSGSGYMWESDRTLPSAISWPTTSLAAPGDLIGSGTTADIAWAIVWSTHNGAECPRIEVVAATTEGDTGSSACAVAWTQQDYPNAVSSVVGVYGQEHATVLMTGPDGMLADVRADGDAEAGGTCGGNVTNAGTWADTGTCIFVIPAGETWRIQPTTSSGKPIGDPYTTRPYAGTTSTIIDGTASAPPASP